MWVNETSEVRYQKKAYWDGAEVKAEWVRVDCMHPWTLSAGEVAVTTVEDQRLFSQGLAEGKGGWAGTGETR